MQQFDKTVSRLINYLEQDNFSFSVIYCRKQCYHEFRKYLGERNLSEELLLAIWNVNVHLCPNCGCDHFRHAGRTYHNRN